MISQQDSRNQKRDQPVDARKAKTSQDGAKHAPELKRAAAESNLAKQPESELRKSEQSTSAAEQKRA